MNDEFEKLQKRLDECLDYIIELEEQIDDEGYVTISLEKYKELTERVDRDRFDAVKKNLDEVTDILDKFLVPIRDEFVITDVEDLRHLLNHIVVDWDVTYASQGIQEIKVNWSSKFEKFD